MVSMTFVEEWSIGTAAAGSYVGAATDGTFLWTVDTGEAAANAITKINLSTHAQVATFEAPNDGGNFTATDLTYSSGTLWIISKDSNTITQIDADDGTVLDSVSFTTAAIQGVAFDGTNLWVGAQSNDTVYEVTTGGTTISSWAIASGEPQPLTLHYDSNRGELWVTEPAEARIWRYETDGTRIQEIDLEGVNFDFNRLSGAALVPGGATLWIITDDDAVQEWTVVNPTLYVSNTGFRFPYPRWT